MDAGYEDSALELVRAVVAAFGPLDVAHTPAHSHPQIRQHFYRSVGLSPFCFVDICVQTHGREVSFTPADPFLLWFDRSGVIRRAAVTPVSLEAAWDDVQARRWRSVLVEKELRRGHFLEVLNYYRGDVLPLLVRALRLLYCPAKADYGLKHISHDLPADICTRLEALHSACTPAEVRWGLDQAEAWLTELLPNAARTGPAANRSPVSRRCC